MATHSVIDVRTTFTKAATLRYDTNLTTQPQKS